jgi:integrase
MDPFDREDRSVGMNIENYFSQYLNIKGSAYRVQTRKIYENTFHQAVTFWGKNTLLRQITPAMAYEFIATRTRIAPHGHGYSPASRNRHLRNCKAAFRMAKTWGYVSENPFAHIRLEKNSPRRWHHLKPGEFQAILTRMEDLRRRVFYLLAYTTGARFGELFNLTWSDIDFDRGAITIRPRPASPELPPFFVKDHEERVLFLPQSTLDALNTWQKVASKSVPYVLLTAERWARVREKWSLCHSGKPWKYNPQTKKQEWAEWENRCMVNNVLRDIRSHARKAGINSSAPLTVHTLRKSFAQNHAHCGTPSATLKALMGHASITTTEKYYLQNSDENTRAAVKRYENLLQEKPQP